MHVNPLVDSTEFPPVTEAANWVKDRVFPDNFPLINVSQAVPGYKTSDEVLEHMAATLMEPDVSKYGHALGLPELRAAYAQSLGGNASHIEDSNVAITAGCNQAFHVTVNALAKHGDEIILPTPWYFNHKMSIDMSGFTAVPLPCTENQQMIPDVDSAKALINDRTRAIVLVTPNNPTGMEYPADTIDAFYTLCKTHNITLIIDETYRDFRTDPTTPCHNIFNDPEWKQTAIHLYSFSKAYALAGYRVGAIAASAAFLNEVTKVIDCVSICAPQLSQRAALFALQNVQEWKREKCLQMQSRANAFQQALQDVESGESEHGYQITAIGSYFAYLKHPFDLSSTQVARFLSDEANLLTLPGEMFGPGQKKHIRVAFANVSRDVMPEIGSRLASFRP